MYGGCLLCPLYPLLLLFIWESVWATENCCLYVIRKRVVDIFFWENRSQETEKRKLRYHYTISVVYLFLTLFINQSDIVKFINQRSCWRGKKSVFVSSLLVENVSHLSYTPPLKEQWAPNVSKFKQWESGHINLYSCAFPSRVVRVWYAFAQSIFLMRLLPKLELTQWYLVWLIYKRTSFFLPPRKKWLLSTFEFTLCLIILRFVWKGAMFSWVTWTTKRSQRKRWIVKIGFTQAISGKSTRWVLLCKGNLASYGYNYSLPRDVFSFFSRIASARERAGRASREPSQTPPCAGGFYFHMRARRSLKRK